MIGTYTRNFGNCAYMAQALRDAGLEVTLKRHFFGCATSVAGRKPCSEKKTPARTGVFHVSRMGADYSALSSFFSFFSGTISSPVS